MKSFIVLLCTATAFAAVDGTVVNQTTGKPQPNAVVTLFKLTQAGPQVVEVTKSDAQGKFVTKQDAGGGPMLVETGYQGVSYNQMLPPGRPTSGITLSVFDSTKDPSAAPMEQHIVFLEPTTQQLSVTEAFFFKNTGKIAYADSEKGTVRFYVPAAAKDTIHVRAVSPNGMPVEREPEAAKTPGAYKLDFAIKPGGETRVDVNYTLPVSDAATFASKSFYDQPPARLVVPNGVTLESKDLKSLGQEPQSQASLYEATAAVFEVKINGTGSLQAAQGGDQGDDSGPSLRVIPPPGFAGRQIQILVLALAILAVGFVLLYRRAAPQKSRG